MWESLFGSAVTPAITSGIGETAVQSALPTITDTAIDTGLANSLAGTGLNSLGQATAGLGLDPTLVGNGLNNSLFQSLGQMPQGFTNAGIGEASNFMTDMGLAPQTSGGMFGEWGDKAMGVLGSDQFKNATALGVGGFNAINQANAISNANDIQKQQLQQSQDAYGRDKKADERRQKLVF